MKEYEVVRKSDNETIDIVFGYSKADAFKRSGYDPRVIALSAAGMPTDRNTNTKENYQ